VRELLNVLRRASLFSDQDRIDGDLVRKMVAGSVFGHAQREKEQSESRPLGRVSGSLADVERAHIEAVLHEMGGNVTRSATALGIDRRTLQRKLKAYGLAGED